MSAEPTSDGEVQPDEIPAGVNLADEIARSLRGNGGQVKLSSGIVLQLKPVPPNLLREVSLQYPDPEVPVVYIESKDRTEPNPNDPDYLRAKEQMLLQRMRASIETLILVGSEPISVPDGMYEVDDDGWMEDFDILGIKPDISTPRRRYLAWLKLYALQTELDIGIVQMGVQRLSGVTEIEVMRALRSFRDS